MRSHLERVLYDEHTILARLDEMAGQIARDYEGRELTVVAVMNGSLMFMADLLRRIPLPLRLDCVGISSYHGATRSSGRIEFTTKSLPDIDGRHVLILDDILDSGETLHAIRERLVSERKPESVRICVLLRKQRPRTRQVDADYLGFDIADEFVVGYGLDYRERYRNLPLIGVLDGAHIGE
jgi:hypoxanthine phosphoribosyltransferase